MTDVNNQDPAITDVYSSTVGFEQLSVDEDWNNLELRLIGTSPNDTVAQIGKYILKYLKNLDCKSAVIEEVYLDQDFSAAFVDFYSKLARPHRKFCQRIHFFNNDLNIAGGRFSAEEITAKLDEASSNGNYLGYLVVRPIKHSPFGRAVLAIRPPSNGSTVEQLVEAEYQAHLLGATLRVRGVPYTQQDTRVGSCAQASIWSVGRHFTTKHGGIWASTSEITAMATKHVDRALSQSVPAGSEFLTNDSMTRALRALDRRPFYYEADQVLNYQIVSQPNKPDIAIPVPGQKWTTMRPEDVIHRYIDSDIPVILGLKSWTGQNIGHAVVATGRRTHQIDPIVALPPKPTVSYFADSFVVNDDQIGPNALVGLRPNHPDSDCPYNLEEHLIYIIIPLPDKVYIAAEAAERIAWDYLTTYQQRWPAVCATNSDVLGSSIDQGTEFIDQISQGRVIARTYLTYGWKYKSRMVANQAHKELKGAIFDKLLSKFIWVTEFGTLDSLNKASYSDQRVFAHVVCDATSSQMQHAKIISHFPGVVSVWPTETPEPDGDFLPTEYYLPDDVSYAPKGYNDLN